MLNTVQYNPETDLLVHVGDLVAKGPDSANVMKTISTHNVTGVRGNHDQKVIEWRGWIEWVLSQEVKAFFLPRPNCILTFEHRAVGPGLRTWSRDI